MKYMITLRASVQNSNEETTSKNLKQADNIEWLAVCGCHQESFHTTTLLVLTFLACIL
jgi:hypothetical protein